MDIIILLVIIVVTYFTGTYIDKMHYANLRKRENAVGRKPLISFGKSGHIGNTPVKKAELVVGEYVVGCDFFKLFVARLISLIGGRISFLETILDRARREAILRMQENAKSAHCIVNVRIDTIRLNSPATSRNKVQNAEIAIMAYGTAITYDL